MIKSIVILHGHYKILDLKADACGYFMSPRRWTDITMPHLHALDLANPCYHGVQQSFRLCTV